MRRQGKEGFSRSFGLGLGNPEMVQEWEKDISAGDMNEKSLR